MTDFVRWVLEEMERRGWRQAELARRANISASHISRMLSGEAQIGIDAAQGIAQAFGMTLEDILRLAGILPVKVQFLREPGPDYLVANDAHLLDLWHALTDDDRIILLTLIERLAV